MRDHLADDIRKRFAFDLAGCDDARAFRRARPVLG
jgi:hypothetical protein